MEDSGIASRLKILINTLGLSDSQFADRCAISRPTLSLLLSGKNKKISDVLLTQIHDAFPEVSILWLLFGEGDKLHTPKQNDQERNLFDENSFFSDTSSKTEEELNLINVNQLEKIIQNVVSKSFESSFNTIENLMIKINETSSSRKVSKITVYYDDSTFDTFVPEKKFIV